nr:hypothetical protein Q903MT_gene810 [Picea sitchensis]
MVCFPIPPSGMIRVGFNPVGNAWPDYSLPTQPSMHEEPVSFLYFDHHFLS